MIFNNRTHAGELLAEKLLKYKSRKPVILALPRGGVPVAAEISARLGAPFDVLVVRKIGAPFNSELAIGAVCESDEPILNTITLAQIGFEPDDIRNTLKSEKTEVQRQIKLFRQGAKLGDLTQNCVIIVDDGLATGATVKAAIRFLQKKGVEHIVVAVPVAPASTARVIRPRVDELVTLVELEDLYSVGQWYRDFGQVSDDEVLSLLAEQSGQNRKLRLLPKSRSVMISLENGDGKSRLRGELTEFSGMKAMIVFTHGSGSGRRSTRNVQVAEVLNRAGFGTLLFDLLTEKEEKNRKNIFDIGLLSQRLLRVTTWLHQQQNLKGLKIGYFGASTGAAAALVAAVQFSGDEAIFAVVSRGGRPDLAGEALVRITAPVLLLVGGKDYDVIELNRIAKKKLPNAKLSIVPNATHLFEESGTLQEVARQAAYWFDNNLKTKIQKVQRPGAQYYA